MIPDIRIEDYDYGLNPNRIAKYPLPERDASKLLRYRDGLVDHFVFRDLPSLLPEESLMVFNDTKVVPARLFFRRETGAAIEIFCLEPVNPPEYSTAFASAGSCRWKCVVGNSKRWKTDVLSLINPTGSQDVADLDLKASLIEKNGETSIVEFTWKADVPFSQVLDTAGKVPIPPYLNRESEAVDQERYQTLYARIRGSVAAPTAGLHFTDRVLEGIAARGIDMENVCLHVGAGTFLPVKSENISGHPMHREPFVVSRELLGKLARGGRPVVAVGTTSVRTLESLYYAGVSCIEKGSPEEVSQWAPYEREYTYSLKESLEAIGSYLDANGLTELKLGTSIIIVPGFTFRVVDYLITNFHQPESTLILLISAFVKGDWRRIYDYALENDFRFLSYGDSSLLKRVDGSGYEDIGPYNDRETAEATSKLARHPYVNLISKYLFPDKPADTLSNTLSSIKKIDEFQEMVMSYAVNWVLDNTTAGLSVQGVENLKGIKGRFLAVSNHRDIILDPAITQYVLLNNNIPLTEIAVGDNLIANETVEMLLRCNRSIKVIRGLPAREMYIKSRALSRYIRHSVSSGRSSVWIAQRQGRTKNGLDLTEQGLLKMFDMSGDGSFAQDFLDLNMVPMSISYEYEPCDILKARELLITSDNGSYVKKEDEDMRSILFGIKQDKGHVNLCIGRPVSEEEVRYAAEGDRNDRYQRLRTIVDRSIIRGYKLWKTNYIAYDIVHGGGRYSSFYSSEDVQAFKDYIESRLDIVKSLDRGRLRDILLGIYSNPVVSKESLL